MKRTLSRFAALPLAALVACGLDSFGPNVELPPFPPAPGEIRVLFIGNSLTYWNDLPGVLEALADSAGAGPVRTGSVTAPDFSLSDHWAEGDALDAIARGGWDYVVMQQGPSALEESRTILIADAKRFAQRIRQVGAEPALYQVWPSQTRFSDFDRSLESYAMAADSVQGLLVPVGSAWRAAWAREPTLSLYEDGLHPTAIATYLAAAVMLRSFTGASPVGLPASIRTPRGGLLSLDPATAATVQAAALDATASLVPRRR